MRVKLTPTTDGKLQNQLATLIDHTTGKPFDVSLGEAVYWGQRAMDINTQSGGDEDFEVRINNET